MARKICRKDNRFLAKLVTGEKAPCAFCRREVDDEVTYGKLYAIGDIQCHYFCVLLSCCLIQKGPDEEGLFGFMYTDILAELERCMKHKCSYCGRAGANMGCCVGACRKQFHLPCGREKHAVSLYFGSYKSFCQQHAPKQKIPDHIMAKARLRMHGERKKIKTIREPDKRIPKDGAVVLKSDVNECKPLEEMVCVICYEAVDGFPTLHTFWPPCCARDAWFHRTCLQRMALSAGMHYLKCPLCNDKENFYDAVVNQGYYVPDRDAAWELEQNAFAEIYERPVSCSVDECRCPMGRTHDADNGDWDIKLCLLCGTMGAHPACLPTKDSNLSQDNENGSNASDNVAATGNVDSAGNVAASGKVTTRFVCKSCLPAAPADIESLADSIEAIIRQEQAAAPAPRLGPAMPSRMSLRRTKGRTAVSNAPSSSRSYTTIKTENYSPASPNVISSRQELDLKPPRRAATQPPSHHPQNQENALFSPTKLLEQRFNEKLKCMGDAVFNTDIVDVLRKTLRKPRPLCEKKRIVNNILDELCDTLTKDAPKQKERVREWCSPKKSNDINEDSNALQKEKPDYEINKHKENNSNTSSTPIKSIITSNNDMLITSEEITATPKQVLKYEKSEINEVEVLQKRETSVGNEITLEAKERPSRTKESLTKNRINNSPIKRAEEITLIKDKMSRKTSSISKTPVKNTVDLFNNITPIKCIEKNNELEVLPEMSMECNGMLRFDILKSTKNLEMSSNTLKSSYKSACNSECRKTPPSKMPRNKKTPSRNKEKISNTKSLPKLKLVFENLITPQKSGDKISTGLHDISKSSNAVNEDNISETIENSIQVGGLLEDDSKIGKTVQDDLASNCLTENDDSSNSTFQLPSEFIADYNSDNSLLMETPKSKTIDIKQDSSLEISENDQSINIDFIKIDETKSSRDAFKNLNVNLPEKSKKCAFKFSPIDKEKLEVKDLGINIDMENFKKEYLNEIDREFKCNFKHKHVEKQSDSKLRTAIDFAMEATIKKEFNEQDLAEKAGRKRKLSDSGIHLLFDTSTRNKKRKTSESDLKLDYIGTENVESPRKSNNQEMDDDFKVKKKHAEKYRRLKNKKLNKDRRKTKKNKKVSKRNEKNIEVTIDSSEKLIKSNRKLKNKLKTQLSIRNEDIQVKIKWKKKQLRLKITDSKKGKQIRKKEKEHSKFKQYVLQYPSEGSSKEVLVKPEKEVTPPKRKYIRQEKNTDKLKQTSIQSFFKLKSP